MARPNKSETLNHHQLSCNTTPDDHFKPQVRQPASICLAPKWVGLSDLSAMPEYQSGMCRLKKDCLLAQCPRDVDQHHPTELANLHSKQQALE